MLFGKNDRFCNENEANRCADYDRVEWYAWYPPALGPLGLTHIEVSAPPDWCVNYRHLKFESISDPMLVSKQPRVQYSEIEAAEILGVTVEQLRSLVKSHIVKDEPDGAAVSVTSFHATDLVLLRILAAKTA
jgi:hypothetical protein